ncbi:MAG: DinB family protein [Gemmatimonadota bacterium]
MTAKGADSRIALLLQNIDGAFGKKAWHGTTLRGSLRGLEVRTALWRPAKGRHNVWEYILHTAYWKYIVRRRLTGDKTLSFPRKPSNWPDPPEGGTAKALKHDIALLQKEHDLLREAIEAFSASRLNRRAPESIWTYADHIHGIAAHDLYHTGQIQLLKRLQR